MKCIAYTRPDGGVSIVKPAFNDKKNGMAILDMTEDEFVQHVIKRSVPVGATKVTIIDDNDVPQSRYFRNAWEQSGANPPSVSMPKARVLKTDMIRKERDEKLSVEDVNYMQADEANDNAAKSAIAAKKQKLRDLPATIQPDLDAIDNADDLEAYEPIWPV